MDLANNSARLSPTIVFSQGISIHEWLTRIGTLSPASHAAIGIGDCLLHVHDAGVVFEPRADWMHNQTLVAEYEIIPDVSHELVSMTAYVGQPYDKIGAWGIAWRRFARALGSPIGLLRGEAPTRTCAAFVLGVGEKIPEWSMIKRDQVVPGDLLRAAEKGPSFRRIA